MLNTMFKKIKKVKKIIDYIAIVGVFYILLYQFEQTRLLCKGMCIYLIDWFLPITILQVKNLYVHGERLFQRTSSACPRQKNINFIKVI